MRYLTIRDYARALRREQTAAEAVVWEVVRARRLGGLKFSRQYVIQHNVVDDKPKYYIADFYCDALQLVLEIDGEVHADQFDYDQLREAHLNQLGYTVIRYTNHQILHDFDRTLQDLKTQIYLLKYTV